MVPPSRGVERPVRWLLLLLLAGHWGPAHDKISGRRTDVGPGRPAELRGFRETGSVLYVAAHPDDENTQLIAYLARGRGYRTAYLSLTRGDGGQNVIGPELFEELGVIRTQELLAARHLDGGRQFFTRAIDFGYSKSAAETLRIWDRTGRGVRHRAGDPHVPARRGDHPVLSPGGRPRPPHGVGDPGRRGVQARGRPEGVPRADRRADRLAAEAHCSRTAAGSAAGAEAGGGAGSIRIEIGGNDPVTGESLGAIAARSRSMHRSQGFGNFGGGGGGGGGPRTDSFTLLAGEPATKDILDGVDTTWARFPGGAEVARLADEAVARFDLKDPAASVPALLAIRKRLTSIPSDSDRGREAAAARPRDPGLPRARGRDDRPACRGRAGRGAGAAARGDGRGESSPSAGWRCTTRSPARRPRSPSTCVPASRPPATRSRRCPPPRR